MKNVNKNRAANASEINSTPKIFISQEGYSLDEITYRILRSEESKWKDWKTRFLFAFIGSLFTLLAKVIEKLAKQESLKLEEWYLKWEVWICIISFSAFIITLILCYFIKKSERDNLIKELDNHFKKSRSLKKIEFSHE